MTRRVIPIDSYREMTVGACGTRLLCCAMMTSDDDLGDLDPFNVQDGIQRLEDADLSDVAVENATDEGRGIPRPSPSDCSEVTR